jgi:MinD superfamily P-loop ATPase
MHDMERVSELASFFGVPAMLCLNKFDLNPEGGQAIESYAREKQIKLMGRIPYDRSFTLAMVQGKNIFEYDGNSEGAGAVKRIWEGVSQELDGK